MLSADMEAYRESGLGENASDELKLVVRDLDYAIKTFQESTTLMAELKIKEAERQIDYITKWLINEAKKIDSNELPNTMNKMTFKSARMDLDGATRLMESASWSYHVRGSDFGEECPKVEYFLCRCRCFCKIMTFTFLGSAAW